MKFTPGWPGMRFDVIPGKEDCETCRNTGWTIVHGAPRRRDGQPRFDHPCDCGRDPIKWLHDECVRKTALANAQVQRRPSSEPSTQTDDHGRSL